MPHRHDVVVVGAGLAGLACARALHRLGADVVVLEADDEIGGRVRTDVVDGFQLDHGFQLYNPAYPAGQRTFDHERLALQTFAPGVEVLREGRWSRLADPLRQPTGAVPAAVASLLGRAGAPWELAAFAAYTARCGRESADALRARPDMSMAEALHKAGVGPGAMERLVAPFLSGVFGDDDLATSRRYGDFVLRTFVRGTPGLPAAGMRALPAQLAAGLPAEAVRTGTRVRYARPGEVGTVVGPVHARVVVVANADLLDSATAWSALTTWYYTLAQDPPHGDRVLVVDGGPDRFLANAAVLTSAAPSYSASGRPLVAASAVGWWPSQADADRSRASAAALVGVDAPDLHEVARYPIRQALPKLLPGTSLRKPIVRDEGLLVIGDHQDTPSIQGALVSGERGAVAAFRQLYAGSRSH